MDKQRGFALAEMCEVLDVSVSGYRAWKRGGKPERKRLTDAQMLALIRAIHAEFKGSYGSPRMVRELRLRGYPASKERVERLMQENGIKAILVSIPCLIKTTKSQLFRQIPQKYPKQ